jgi:hypothetical protein
VKSRRAQNWSGSPGRKTNDEARFYALPALAEKNNNQMFPSRDARPTP